MIVSELKRFSDFAEEEKPIEGDKVKIETILDQEIFVIGYKIKKSKYEKSNSEQCLTIQFEINGNKRILFTGSNVLLDQIKKYSKEMPFLTTIKKIDKYYTFS